MQADSLEVYTKESLQNYIEAETQRSWEERDFVKDVRRYLNSESRRVLLVLGLRSTGKTSGILQALNPESSLYLCPLFKESITEQEVFDIIENSDCKNIVIDEFSWIKWEKDCDKLTNYLAGIAKMGKKVILTGTESIYLNRLKYTELIHRSISVHTTYFPYDEFCRLYHLEHGAGSMDKYLTSGGIFDVPSGNKYNIADYIENSIINNISSSFKDQPEEQIKASIYQIFYDCICKSYNLGYSHVYNHQNRNQELSAEEFLEMFGVNPALRIDPQVFSLVASALEDIEVIIKIPDLRIGKNYRTYLTNQTLSALFIKEIYHLDELAPTEYGKLFEASVVCNFYKRMPVHYRMYYLDGRKQGIDYEIDFILRDEESHEHCAYLFECKHSGNSDYHISPGASLVKELISTMLGDYDVVGRYVIYRGNPKVETINNYQVYYTNDWAVADSFESFQQKLSCLDNAEASDELFSLISKGKM